MGKESSVQLDNLIAALVTIGGAVLFPYLSPITNWWVFAVFFMVLFVVLFGLLILQTQSSSRYIRYTEALQPIHRFHHALRNAFCSDRGGDTEDTVKNHVQGALKNFSMAFSLITGTTCRSCIKILYLAEMESNEDRTNAADLSATPIDQRKTRSLAVKTYCRCDITDEPPKNQDSKDWVSDNSDFLDLLMEPDKTTTSRCFFRNILPYPGYKNSHYSEAELKNGEMTYRSTIVWPIRKKPLTMDQDSGTIGFLCIDSKAKNAFCKPNDVEIGAACADALYMLLQPIIQ